MPAFRTNNQLQDANEFSGEGTVETAQQAAAQDFCPICKLNRYNTPTLRFKVSSKCYHRICEGCVDRTFASGRQRCPIASCQFELWKRDWREQTFQDLQIEREVDIRRRVFAILNRREDEFETKRDWDDFLETREEMVMNLSLGTDVAATNKRLREYEKSNTASIKANAALARAEPDLVGSAEISRIDGKESPTDRSGLVKGLKKLELPAPVEAYDPFMGMPTMREYYSLRDDYPLRRLAKAKIDKRTLAGGFDFEQYYDESLLRAFAGLGCFLQDELHGKDQTVPPDLTMESVTEGAQNDVRADIGTDDVF